MTASSISCPQCGQIDSVRKVSSIVNAGTSSSMYSGYGDGIGYSAHETVVMDEFITIKGVSQTHLSKLLSPPIKPHTIYLDDLTFFMIIAGAIGLITVPFGLSNIFTSQFVTGTILLLFGLTCLGITVWIAVRYSEPNKNKKIRFDNNLLVWEKAINRWQLLYYCYRCDGVYVSNLNFIVPTQYMMDFLYYK